MVKIAIQSFKIEQSNKSDLLTELADLDPEEYKGMELFRGIAISDDVNSHMLQFQPEAQRQVAQQLNNQIGVFTNHNIKAENRIGKTLRANRRNGNVYTTFGVIPGLQAAKTDDLIKIMETAGSEMSISFYPSDDGIECSSCGKPINAYSLFFWTIWMCENEHMLGDRYENDKGELETVIGKVISVDRVSELSVVGNGSDPNTEVVKQAANDLDIDADMLAAIAELNGIDIEKLPLHVGDIAKLSSMQLKSHDKSNQIDLRRLKMATPTPEPTPTLTPTPTPVPGEPKDGIQQSLDDLNKQLAEKVNENAQLQKQLEAAKSEEDFNALALQVTNLQAELATEKEKTADYENIKATLDIELEHWRTTACSNKKKQMGYKDTDPRYIAYKQWADNCNDIARLRIDAMSSISAYATACLETPTMGIDVETDTPRVGSGYTN